MKNTSRILTAAMFALALPLGLSAQVTDVPATPPATAKLEIGKWTGTVAPPGGQELALTIEVKMAGDTMKAELVIPDVQMTMALSNIKLEGKKLSFSFQAGDMGEIKCALDQKEDGTYTGPCTDPGGSGAPMTIAPPKKGDPIPAKQ
jgi:hypothetical protein